MVSAHERRADDHDEIERERLRQALYRFIRPATSLGAPLSEVH
jgi:hypothetical protein